MARLSPVPRLPARSIMLDWHREHSNLAWTTGHSIRFQLQNQVAMVISGDFLVSVGSGQAAGSLAWRRGPGGVARDPSGRGVPG